MASRSGKSTASSRKGGSTTQSPTSSSLSLGRSDRRGSARSRAKKEEEKETLAFKVLTQDHTKQLLDIQDVDQVQDKVVEILELGEHSEDLQKGSVLDYYVAGVWWGKEQNYTLDQLSAFYTVLHTMMDNVKEKHLSLVENLKELRKMLSGIGQENCDTPGGLEGCFDVNQAKTLTDYIHTCLFQHYRLYEFMFCHTQAEEIIGTDLLLELALPSELPWPPPLEEAVPLDVHTSFIATPPPTPTIEDIEGPGEEGEGEKEGEEVEGGEGDKEADLLAKLSPEQVTQIMNEVFEEMLGGLKSEVASKLREKENNFISRINKIHKVADK